MSWPTAIVWSVGILCLSAIVNNVLRVLLTRGRDQGGDPEA